MKQIEIEFKNEGKDTRRMKSYTLNRRTDPDPEDISFGEAVHPPPHPGGWTFQSVRWCVVEYPDAGVLL